jgi:hypothetical protein
MKLFEIVLEERIGEKEWTHNLLVQAKTLKSAEKKAHKYARRYWSSWEDNEPVHKNEDGAYEFNGGEIVVSVEDVSETTKERFCQEAFERAMIS